MNLISLDFLNTYLVTKAKSENTVFFFFSTLFDFCHIITNGICILTCFQYWFVTFLFIEQQTRTKTIQKKYDSKGREKEEMVKRRNK